MDFSILISLAGDAFSSDIGKDMTKFILAWFIVKRTIKLHFSAIESSLQAINKSVEGLKNAMRDVENAHSNRLSKLETEVSELRTRGVLNGKGL